MNLPQLDPIELRVLGSLIEKSKTTPDYYPMSLNGLTAACNQKTSRKPVVSYHEETVSSALNSLKKRNLVSTSFEGSSSRVLKYKHNFGSIFPLIPSEVAVLCVLILRGAQTPGEVNTNSGRLHEFESIEEIVEILEKLAGEEPPYVVRLSKRPGQKEGRYAHLLGGQHPVDDEEIPEVQIKNTSSLEIRIRDLEIEVEELKRLMNSILEKGFER